MISDITHIIIIALYVEAMLIMVVVLAQLSPFFKLKDKTKKERKYTDNEITVIRARRRVAIVLSLILLFFVTGGLLFYFRPIGWCEYAYKMQSESKEEDAIKWFNKIIEVRPGYVKAYCYFVNTGTIKVPEYTVMGLAAAYYNIGEYTLAEKYYKRALLLYRKKKKFKYAELIAKMVERMPAEYRGGWIRARTAQDLLKDSEKIGLSLSD
ncbi:MAG: tetratricopeptide repeat protein [Candidatus Omnitrophica bacterium]|nr:tetratricopeptide repeat protein [Candidatus Omnitrophota bacterium]MDD5080578.1 tetratricopeptide repeat protein [Candidatus Omnitrophota bacterium]MDD5441071.1 tetratricopeptide repeat protein [Candidatus Omnitrophota bacterium]